MRRTIKHLDSGDIVNIYCFNLLFRLTLTGHSLGGAQAQFTAATLVHDGVIPSNRLTVYTFGAPRFGNPDFAEKFDLVSISTTPISNMQLKFVCISYLVYLIVLHFTRHVRYYQHVCGACIWSIY